MNRQEPDNPAQPPSGVRLCRLDEIAEAGARGFRFREGRTLFAGFIVRQGLEIAGYIDSCPHNGWPLAIMDDRYLTADGRRIICAAHGAVFRPGDGLCVAGPCEGETLTAWPVVVQGGEVFTA